MTEDQSHQIWHEVSLRFLRSQAGAEEVLRQIFCRLGFDETRLTLTYEKTYGYFRIYCKTENESHYLAAQLASLKLKKVFINERPMRFADWRDKWKDAVRPFHLTERFDVVPVWNMADYRPGRREAVYLDTILSFGTGLHETTRFMAGLIEGCQGKFETFLDIGTGTGLLSIIGFRCGAKELWAVDHDIRSIETAEKNLRRNGIKFDRCSCMDFRKFSSRKQFDFIAANVITDELIAMKRKMISSLKPEKYLAVSGISLDNLARFKKEFRDGSLRCLKIIKGKMWAALLYKKIKKIDAEKYSK